MRTTLSTASLGLGLALWLLSACRTNGLGLGSVGQDAQAGGGTGRSGGAVALGGTVGSGGASADAAAASGGQPGGALGSGGASTGGSVGSGGRLQTGGAVGSGGAGSGAVVAGGRTSGTGGATMGGRSSTGGSVASGGEGRGGAITTGGRAGGSGAGGSTGGMGGVSGLGGGSGTSTGGARADGGAAPPEAGSAGCDQLATQSACEARSDCHAVFEESNLCACATPGCCARFTACAAGATADCVGPATCKMATPACSGPYVVAYLGSCFEGCVWQTVCARADGGPPVADANPDGPAMVSCSASGRCEISQIPVRLVSSVPVVSSKCVCENNPCGSSFADCSCAIGVCEKYGATCTSYAPGSGQLICTMRE
jgi:hypothetical protein